MSTSCSSGSNGANHNNNNNSSSGSSSSSSSSNEKDRIWYFNAEQLANSPSRRCGIKADQELSYRQLTAYLIQEMGQRLQVSQLCINTAIVYMHRFYAFHSFTHFHRNSVAAASLFLAAKVEEQPRKLEHVIKAANKCLPQNGEVNYAEQAQDLVFNENVLLQTLGFDVAIDHPHTHVVKTCHLVKACKDLAQTSYFLASNSLHLTSMCLQYRPTVVACFCIYLACKWSRWEIPQSTEGRHWFYYVDKTVTLDLLKQLTDEFIAIYEKSPTRLQSKLNSIKAIAQGAGNRGSKDKSKEDFKMGDIMKGYHSSINTSDSNSNGAYSSGNEAGPQTPSSALLPPPTQPPLQQQMRKSDMHSSQHRTHHGSSSVSASHHHSKPPYPGSGDVLADHKSKQQGSYGSSSMNRPLANHQSMSSSSSSSSSSAQRGNVPPGSGRPSSSSSLSSQRPPPPQMHPMDYHKSSRDRNGMNLMPGAHNLPPPPNVAHKMPPKQDAGSRSSSSSSSKDPMGRSLPEQQSKQSSTKLYPSGPQPYGSNQLPTTQSSKIDDPARAIMHGQRGYMPGSSAGSVAQSSGGGYHHHRSSGIAGSSATGSSNTLSTNSNISTKSSVHGLPHAPYEQLPQPYGSSSSSNSQSHQQNYGIMRSSSDMSTAQLDEHTSNAHSHPPIHPLLAQSKAASASGTSLFSPDWKDKQHLKTNASHDSLSYKLSGGNSRDKNSPKKDRNSNTGTPTKKDKSRMLTSSSASASTSSSMTSSTSLNAVSLVGMRNDQHLKPVGGMPRKSETTLSGAMTGLNELAGASHGANGGIKRSNETTGYVKHEDDISQRENKIRKLEGNASATSSVLGGLPSFAFPGSSIAGNNSSLTDSSETKHPIAMTNGMETTPDLVRSLLKESLCTTSVIKTEPLMLPGLKPPAELLDPCAGQQSSVTFAGSVNNNNGSSNNNNSSSTSNPDTSMDAQTTEHSSSNADDSKLESMKSEKKKKKDKHKHKEKDKDKSKDREERKKHKKDKDKHKDRDRDSDNLEHVKLVIPKEKLESLTGGGGNGGASGDLKLKIPKDRFKAENNGLVAPHLGPPGLKIKISKDILETYSTGASNFAANAATDQMLHSSQLQSLQVSAGGGHMQLGMPHGMSVGGMSHLGALSAYGLSTQSISGIVGSVAGGNTSSKKRDRDREREKDKEKKRGGHEFLKYNGNTNLLPSGLVPTTAAPLLPMPNATSMATATAAAMSSLPSAYTKK